MSAKILSQKEYLKRYLGKAKKKKKSKDKDKESQKSSRLKVVDDSLNLSCIPFGCDDDDDAPTIAEITYEDKKLKAIEEFHAVRDKWKTVSSNSEVCGASCESVSQMKYASASEEECAYSPIEPKRLHPAKGNYNCNSLSPRMQRHDSDSSPPQKERHDSDSSPPKKERHDSDSSPPRKQRHDSDSLPSRKERHDSDLSPPKKERHDSDSSPPRKQRHDSDSSPPRKERHDSDSSPPRKQRHDSDSSPPRKQRHDSDSSPAKKQRHDSDSSLPRKQRHDSDSSPPRKQRHDSDSSPPRKQRHDSDSSPPKKQRHDCDESLSRKKKHHFGSLSPRKQSFAHGSSSQRLVESSRVSVGSSCILTDKPAPAVHKKLSTKDYLIALRRGRLKDDSLEALARKEREVQLQNEAEIKHKEWNRGVIQGKQCQDKAERYLHEMTKPLARHVTDVDMNRELKDILRKEDPLFDYIVQKQAKEAAKGKQYPVYQGPFPPNRYNIRPGFRWDGCDRSSGFEKKWFESQINKKAAEEEYYQWRSEDL